MDAAHPAEGFARPILDLLKVAAPTVATMTSYTLMTFTDKWLVSRISPDPIYVGAQGNGGLVSWVAISLCHGLLMVVNTYVAQNLGAGKPERGPAYAWNAIWIALAYWILVLVPYSFALPALLRVAGVHEAQAALAAEYGRILLWGAGFTLAARAMSQFFFGMHKAGVVLLAGVLANALNLWISAALVFGSQHMPASFGVFGDASAWLARALHVSSPLGVTGSAIGTVVATAIELLIPLALFLSPAYAKRLKTRESWRPSLDHTKELLKLGWPGALYLSNEMVCWGFFMVYLVSHFGKHHATAGWIAHQYMSLSFMPTVGISVAVTAAVGKCMGMQRPDLAARRAWVGVLLAAAYMSVCGVCFVLFRERLIRLFIEPGTPPDEQQQLIRLGSTFLIATAAFQFFDGVAMTLSGALRGAGDTVWPGVVTLVCSWTIIVGGGLAMIHLFPTLESLGAWIAAAAYIIVLGLAFLARFLAGHWRSIRLVDAA